MYETGWFAEECTDAPHAGFTWRAVLQLPGLVVPTDGLWFDTEAECLDFIRDDIIGQGLFPARRTETP
jgi:hypothetical protein